MAVGRKAQWISLGLAAVLAGILLLPGVPLARQPVERLSNGGFEAGSYASPFGSVGEGWSWFSSGGRANVSFYADDWAAVVWEGSHSQLIGINTYAVGAPDANQFAGLHQTVAVVPGETYEFSLRGMMRAREDDPDRPGYNYRVRYGVDLSGGSDWRAVKEWIELPWDTVYPMLSPGAMQSFSAPVTASGKRLTVFVGLLKKWATAEREVVANLDAISLKGAMPDEGAAGVQQLTYTVVKPGEAGYTVVEGTTWANAEELTVGFVPPQFPVAGWDYTVEVISSNDVGVTKIEFYDGEAQLGMYQVDIGRLNLARGFAWKPAAPGRHVLRAIAYDAAGAGAIYEVEIVVGALGEFITNGGFEVGFVAGPAGEVGAGWGWFHTGGGAAHGFYDDTWAAVVHAGDHSQLIEINTFCCEPVQPNRYAGLYQTVKGLTVGATYKLRLRGMLRALADDPDREGYAYRVQWGYLPGNNPNWATVTNWVEVPWDTVHDRLEPGQMSSYTAMFIAPQKQVTLFVRAWKKWATPNRELDVNLDGISLTGYK